MQLLCPQNVTGPSYYKYCITKQCFVETFSGPVPSTGNVCGICTVWLMEWHNHLHINNNLWIIITDCLSFTSCQVTKYNSLFFTHFQLFI